MEKNQNLSTIFWMEDYKNKLKDYIKKEEITIKYLKNIIKYFETNNITIYKKFDKRDFDKIKKHLEKMLYYNDCGDNIGVYCNDDVLRNKELYIYVNNERQYNADIDIYTTHLDDTREYKNVLDQAKNRLEYVQTIYKQNKKILKNFDQYMDQFNKKVKDFKKFIDKTSLNNIIDIYIYARDED